MAKLLLKEVAILLVAKFDSIQRLENALIVSELLCEKEIVMKKFVLFFFVLFISGSSYAQIETALYSQKEWYSPNWHNDSSIEYSYLNFQKSGSSIFISLNVYLKKQQRSLTLKNYSDLSVTDNGNYLHLTVNQGQDENPTYEVYKIISFDGEHLQFQTLDEEKTYDLYSTLEGMTAVNNVREAEETEEVYDVSGYKKAQQSKGLNIIKRGKDSKVVLKK